MFESTYREREVCVYIYIYICITRGAVACSMRGTLSSCGQGAIWKLSFALLLCQCVVHKYGLCSCDCVVMCTMLTEDKSESMAWTDDLNRLPGRDLGKRGQGDTQRAAWKSERKEGKRESGGVKHTLAFPERHSQIAEQESGHLEVRLKQILRSPSPNLQTSVGFELPDSITRVI